jgi:hypothetical protein
LNCDWKKGDGGELCLTPFLKRNVKVKPLHDRLCAFYADRVLHRVEPSFVERFCLTVWLDGEPGFVNTPEDVTLRLPKSVLQNPDAVADHLRYSATQRSLSRAVYREVYESSLVKCMKDAPGCAEMLASHEAAVQAVARNEPLSALVEALRERKAFAEMGGGGGGVDGVIRDEGTPTRRRKGSRKGKKRLFRFRSNGPKTRASRGARTFRGRGGGRRDGFGWVLVDDCIRRARRKGFRGGETRPARSFAARRDPSRRESLEAAFFFRRTARFARRPHRAVSNTYCR